MTFQEILSLPFQINHRLYRVYGLIRLEPGQLVLEFQSVENLLGLLRGRIRILEIPFNEIMEVQLDKGKWGGKRLHMRTLHLHTLRKLPGALQGMCTLQIRRGDTLLADNVVSQLELALAEAKLAAVKPPPKQSLPPPQSRWGQFKSTWEQIKGLLP